MKPTLAEQIADAAFEYSDSRAEAAARRLDARAARNDESPRTVRRLTIRALYLAMKANRDSGHYDAAESCRSTAQRFRDFQNRTWTWPTVARRTLRRVIP